MQPSTRPARVALLLAGLVLVACEHAPEPPGPATRLRLWVDGAAELREGPPPEPPELLYESDFATELPAWAPTWDVSRSGPGPEVRTRVEEERTLLELSGEHGALERIFAVEPDTCYVFEGLVRAEGIESEPARLDGARFWLAEASGPATYAELCTTKSELLGPDWTSPSAASGAGWTPMRRLFVTRSRTQYLHVVCALSTRATVRAGHVQFAALRLERHPREREWVERLELECARRAATDPPAAGDQGRRRLAAELGGESRPSVVLLPGERMRFPLPALAPGARLRTGAGAWPPDALPFRGQDPRSAGRRAELEVLLDGQPLLARPLELARKPVEARWESLELALADGARELELVSRGSLPLALGAPLVTTAAPPPPRPSVLLVSIDTLRADHFGPAADRASFTPNLDRLAARALVCPDASAPSPYTLPSHATLLTGQFPSVHGVVAHENRLSRTRSTSLAERLGREGHATAAFTAGGFVHPAFGLDQGFERFTQVDPIREPGSHFHRTLQRKIDPAEADRRMREQGLEGVERWLRDHAGAPFFLFLHTYTVHDYDVPPAYLACAPPACTRPQVPLSTPNAAAAEAYTPAMRAHIRHLYEAALRYTDERLGRLLALLEELDLARSTLIVVTSDHGEEFFEHGLLQHGHTLYEELVRIPLLLAGPGIEPGRLAQPAMLVDVVPTLLARIGLARPEHLQGVDLCGPRWPARAVWSEVDSRFARKYALRTPDGLKTIQGPETQRNQRPNARAWELYDLEQDPGEQRDLALGAPERLAAARAELERHRATLEALGRALGSAAEGELDAETLAELEALGYVGE